MRDIPQTLNLVPRALIEDRNALSVQDTLSRQFGTTHARRSPSLRKRFFNQLESIGKTNAFGMNQVLYGLEIGRQSKDQLPGPLRTVQLTLGAKF